MKDHSKLNIEMDDLLKELLEENGFLTKLVDTIPAKMYFEHDIKEKIVSDNHSAVDKVLAAFKKKPNDIELSAKAKHKRARMNPMHQKSISQIQGELGKQEKKETKKNFFASSVSLTRATNIEELQRRLQEKISALQAQRKATVNDPEKKKQLKQRVKKLKHRGNKVKAPKVNDKELKKPKVDPFNAKPMFNKDCNLIYSKFDFSEVGFEDKEVNEYSGKQVKSLLKRAELKKEKIESLKNTDPEKGKTVEEKEKWKSAILKSKGLKVKDDPHLLKKALKRVEMKKKKSAKAWQGRKEDIERKQKARQDKRSRNIKQKKKEKLDKKIKAAKKKGRVIPGF